MIDALTPADAAAAAALSAGFSWPHRVEDWAFFLTQGEGLAWREGGGREGGGREGGVLLGTAMTFPFGAEYATIGLVQVAPSLQGRGIGRRLMEAVIDLAGGRTLRLHATAAGAGLYARLGFVAQGVVQQWQGTAKAGGGTVRVAGDDDLAAILALDRAATGLPREALLRRLVRDGIVHLSGEAAAPSGYAIRRSFGRGALIGPVVATDLSAAAALVAGLTIDGFVRVDIQDETESLAPMLAGAGLKSVEDVQVMVRGTWPRPDGLFALSSQAMG